jgi:hypothetical protein
VTPSERARNAPTAFIRVERAAAARRSR